MDYYIRIKKDMREEMAEKYPNLAKTPNYLNAARLSTQADLRNIKDSKVKKIIEEKLKDDGMKTNDKYDYGKKETAHIVEQVPASERDNDDPVFEGEVKIPEEYRTEGDSKKKDKQALRA